MVLPSNQMFRIMRECQFVREPETLAPVYDFPVRIRRLFGAEWGPPHEAFEHDRTDRPPITQIGIALSIEYFGCNIVRGSDGRISHSPTRFSPSIDLATIGHSQVDSVREEARVPVLVFRCRSVF